MEAAVAFVMRMDIEAMRSSGNAAAADAEALASASLHGDAGDSDDDEREDGDDGDRGSSPTPVPDGRVGGGGFDTAPSSSNPFAPCPPASPGSAGDDAHSISPPHTPGHSDALKGSASNSSLHEAGPSDGPSQVTINTDALSGAETDGQNEGSEMGNDDFAADLIDPLENAFSAEEEFQSIQQLGTWLSAQVRGFFVRARSFSRAAHFVRLGPTNSTRWRTRSTF